MKIYIHLLLIFCSVTLYTDLAAAEKVKPDAHCEYGIPEADQKICRKGYVLGYDHEIRLSKWSGYNLLKRNLLKKQVKRRNRFKADPEIKVDPVRPSDYRRTGYDRGHLVPAADMTYSRQTEEESFYMTNIVPQAVECNRGIWKKLEEQVRAWALDEEKIYVLTGPVFTGPQNKIRKLGKTDIPVPTHFYKIVYDLTPPRKMIAFLIPNRDTTRKLESFILPVDEIEQLTGLNFFSTISPEEELMLEAISNIKDWQKSNREKKK